MGKGALKFGGKSGILPTPRPIFRRNPIRAPTAEEREHAQLLEQGYAEGVPEPQRAGMKFPRAPLIKPVVTVSERIAATIDRRAQVDAHKASQVKPEVRQSSDFEWELKKNEIRREHLRAAYLAEEKRLVKLDELKQKQAKRAQEEKARERVYEESDATKLTLPTVDSYLQGSLMRQRTPEERAIMEEQRTINRKRQDLAVQEQRALDVLDLYHAASEFITTEAELDQAIKDAFEVNVGKFESKQMAIENKLAGHAYAVTHQTTNEGLVMDHALGEINGQPGLDSIESTLDGEIERLRLEAQYMASQQNQ